MSAIAHSQRGHSRSQSQWITQSLKRLFQNKYVLTGRCTKIEGKIWVPSCRPFLIANISHSAAHLTEQLVCMGTGHRSDLTNLFIYMCACASRCFCAVFSRMACALFSAPCFWHSFDTNMYPEPSGKVSLSKDCFAHVSSFPSPSLSGVNVRFSVSFSCLFCF